MTNAFRRFGLGLTACLPCMFGAVAAADAQMPQMPSAIMPAMPMAQLPAFLARPQMQTAMATPHPMAMPQMPQMPAATMPAMPQASVPPFGTAAMPDAIAKADPAMTVPQSVPGAAATGQTHAVVAGDTFWKLSRHYYGDPQQWHRIAEANPEAAARDLVIGTTLVIPQ